MSILRTRSGSNHYPFVEKFFTPPFPRTFSFVSNSYWFNELDVRDGKGFCYPSIDHEFSERNVRRLSRVWPMHHPRGLIPRGSETSSTDNAMTRNDVRRDATGTDGHVVNRATAEGGLDRAPEAAFGRCCVYDLVAAAFAGDEDGHRDDDADADAARSNHGATRKPPERPHLFHPPPCDLGSSSFHLASTPQRAVLLSTAR